MIQFFPRMEISNHTGIFSGRFPIHTTGIFPPCWIFSGNIPIEKNCSSGDSDQCPFLVGSHPLQHLDHKDKDIEESTKGQGHRRLPGTAGG
jgi:hypothetical protein